MSLQTAIATRLAAVSGVTDLVSTRIYWKRAPQDVTMPAIIFEETSWEPAHSFGSTPSVAISTIRVNCLSETSISEAGSVADAVRAALDNYAATVGGVTIQSCISQGKSDEDELDVGIYIVPQDYQIIYTL